MDLDELLSEKCVYWPPAPPNRSGQKGYGNPVELACHWEDMQEERWAGNNAWTSKAQVILGVEVLELGVLWYGLLSAAKPAPFQNVDATEVRQVERVPSVDGTEQVYAAYL